MNWESLMIVVAWESLGLIPMAGNLEANDDWCFKV